MKINEPPSRKQSDTILVNANQHLLSYFIGDENSEELFQTMTDRGVLVENTKIEIEPVNKIKHRFSIDMRVHGMNIFELDDERRASMPFPDQRVSIFDTQSLTEREIPTSLIKQPEEKKKTEYFRKNVQKPRERRPVGSNKEFTKAKIILH
jgi:hypothetical protein